MRYMLLICDKGAGEPCPPELATWQADLERRGVKHSGARLRPSSEAVTVRVRDNAVLTTNGPFAETAEQVGGYEIVDCADLDEAIAIAGGHPGAARFAVEIRPFREG
jgi:hypothetical protein